MINIEHSTTDYIIQEIELVLAQNLSKIDDVNNNEYELPSQNMNDKENYEMSSPKDIKKNKTLHKNNKTIINCQVCRQRVKNWFEISNCSHK